MRRVKAELVVLSGVNAGRRTSVRGEEVTVGRKAEVDLQFDPEEELAVSGLHASITPSEAGWMLRDLGSLNGTLVNGERISGPVLLQHGDRLRFGENGPEAEFRLKDPGGGPDPVAPGKSSPSSRRLWAAVAALSVALIGVILLAVHAQREGRRYRDQALAMQERIDSILEASATTAAALEGRIEGLHEALLRSRDYLQDVRRDLEAAEEAGDSQEIQELRTQLQEAQTALVRQQLAANLDYDAIEEANRRAVAKVFVDFGDGAMTATAFAVRSDAVLMTSRHVVSGPDGNQRPLRLAVQFADSRQIWPAHLVATSPVDDLALLKVDNILGEVPVISGFNTNPRAASPGQGVAVIGFPLGGVDSAGEGGEGLARTILSAGVVSAVSPEVVEVNGYGVEGSSGSPVFDEDGSVVGVLYGGRVENGERTLFAVPASRAAAFLNQMR